MKWKILSLGVSDPLLTVELSRGLFHLTGVWTSSQLPAILDEVNIEVDINLPLEELCAAKLDAKVYKSTVNAFANEISGLIESIDTEDSLHYFRISADCLIMIESRGVILNLGSHYEIHVPRQALSITPF